MIRPLLVILVLACLVAEASADRRVAVATIEGDQGGAATKIVVAALDGEGDYLVITPKAVTKVADELAIAIDERQAAKLLEELEADVLVMGTVEPISGGNRLILRVVPKGSKKARSATVLYGKKAASGKVRGGIRNAITTILEKESGGRGEEGDEGEVVRDRTRPVKSDGPTTLAAEGDEPETPVRSGSGGGDRVVPKRAITGGTGKRDKRFVTFKEEPSPDAEVTKGLDGEDPNGEAEEEEAPKPKAAGRRVIALRFAAGPSGSTRTLQFNHRAFDQAPRDYRNSFVPGARVQGELYPAAFGTKGFLSNLGIGFEFDQTFGLKVNAGGGTQLPTTSRHFSVDARIRFPIGGSSISLVGGYGQRTFKVTRGQTMLDLPNTEYKMFNPGLAFRVPVGPVSIFGDARALLLTSAGEIQTNDSYGPGKVSAFEAEAGFEIEITRTIGVRVSGDVAIVGYDFNGKGAMSSIRDQDPTTVDVGGAADRYIGGAVALALRL
jgi:hypothetical protein